MKKMMTRALSAALALTMCVGLLNVPAFAADAKVLTCGTPEHSHTSACYATDSVLTCTESTEDQVVIETETTTVVDEETGEETVVTQEVTKVIPADHTHGAGCYSEESVLTCTAALHTHIDSCYSTETRDVEADEDEGTVTVTPPSEFTAETKDEDGNTIESTKVKVEDNGTATVTVNGKEIEATVKTEVTSKPVNTAVGSQTGETTSEVTDRVTNADGSVTVYTEYTTTYTTEVTTGYWVTYTVTYTEPTTYTVDKSDGLDVTVDENGDIAVNGINGEYDVTVNGVDENGNKINGTYSVKSDKDGFYVTIDGKRYAVTWSVNNVGNDAGNYIVSWKFADTNTKIEIADGTQEKPLPEGVKIDEKGNVTLEKDEAMIGENKFVVKDDKTYIVVDGLEYEVELTASGDATNGYTLKWNYKVDNLPVGSVEKIEFDPKGTTDAVKDLGKYGGFAAIVLPDGTYHEASTGGLGVGNWLTTAKPEDVWVTIDPYNGSQKITIHYGVETQGAESASFPCYGLDGYNVTNVTYSCVIDKTEDGDSYLIVKINGITVQDQNGNTMDKTLTVQKNGKGLAVTATTQAGNATVGGTETKYVTISSLTGGAHVVVKTQDGKEVTMTYSEYLEATAEGENLVLKGVLESSIPPQPTPPSGGEPVIPVIPPVVIEDPDVPLTDLPEIGDEDVPPSDEPDEVVIDDGDVPLTDLPDEVVIDDGDVPLTDLPDEIEIEDGEVPLADVPQTGDISSMWYVVSVLSAAGFLALTVLERRQRRQA